jgi:hypothetical protein
MIISASRRTDIPAYYSEWFCNRINEGFVLTRNPMNFHQVSKINLSPDAVDGIVFWTKNPIPMLDKLGELENKYMYYFQFSLTPYGAKTEPALPSKTDVLIPAFKKLSNLIGADRVIWRYDPILLNGLYTAAYHLRAFEKIAGDLHNYTRKVTISFIDTDYRGVKSNSKELGLHEFPKEAQYDLGAKLAGIASKYGLAIDTCAEAIDLSEFGVGRARCIDGRLLAKLTGRSLKTGKDKNQRPECGCVYSVDIGMYNTCKNGCRYCYANYNRNAVDGNYAKHNPLSPLLCGEICDKDKITDRKAASSRIL